MRPFLTWRRSHETPPQVKDGSCSPLAPPEPGDTPLVAALKDHIGRQAGDHAFKVAQLEAQLRHLQEVNTSLNDELARLRAEVAALRRQGGSPADAGRTLDFSPAGPHDAPATKSDVEELKTLLVRLAAAPSAR